jgi:hypothetical protein
MFHSNDLVSRNHASHPATLARIIHFFLAFMVKSEIRVTKQRSPENSMPDSSYVYLKLTGDFDPAEVAALIPLAPYESWAKHSRFPDRQIPKSSILKYSRYDTHAEIPDVYSLSEQLVDTLEPHQDVIARAIQEHQMQCCLQVVLLFTSDESVSTPIIGFSERVTRFLGTIFASIDIDTYRGEPTNGEQDAPSNGG